MTESDHRLVNRFFEKYSQPLEDQGFSEKVMRHLPDRIFWLNRVWSVLCTLVGIAIFILVKGWQSLVEVFQALLMENLKVVSSMLSHLDFSWQTLLMVLVGSLTLLVILVCNMVWEEK